MKKVVGILRGGIFENYEKSLIDGGKLISHIFEKLSHKWKPVDILVDKKGIWHFGGLPIKPSELINKVDVVWNTSHSNYSKTFSDLSIPNIGHSYFSKEVLGNRELLKEHMKKIGIKMPRAFVIPVYQKDFDGELVSYIVKKAKEVFEKFSSPWIIKPLTEDFNISTHVAKTFPELVDAIADCVQHKKSILVEEFIFGKDVSVHSVSNFRGEDVYSFPPIENRDGVIISPGKFSSIEKEKLLEISKKIYYHTNALHYLKSNFVLHPRGIYLNCLEFFPNVNKESGFSKSCESVGTKTHDVINHILENS